MNTTLEAPLVEAIQAICSETDRVALLQALRDKTQPFLNFHDTAVWVINESEDHYYQLSPSRSIDGERGAESEKITYKGSAISKCIEELSRSGETLVIDEPEHLEQSLTHHSTISYLPAYSVATTLQIEGKIIGVWFIHAAPEASENPFSEVNRAVLKYFANALAIALSNLLVRQTISDKEKEKSLLLSMSNAIAKATSFPDLMTSIRNEISHVIRFDNCSLIIVNGNSLQHYVLSEEHDDDKPREGKLYSTRDLRRSAVSCRYAEYLAALDGREIPFIEYIDAKEESTHPYKCVLGDMAEGESLVTVLKSGTVSLGTLWLHSNHHQSFRPQHLGLLKAIAEQVSLAIANILAKEELQKRAQEKAFFLEIVQALSTISAWDQKFLRIAELVNSKVPCALFSYSIRFDDGRRAGAGFVRNGDSRFKVKTIWQYLEDMNVTMDEYVVLYQQAQTFFSGDRALNGQELIEESLKWPLLKLSIDAYKTKSMMFVTRPFSQGDILFTLNSEQENGFSVASVDWLKGISNQIVLSIENLIAHEDIRRHDQEKALQLGLNNTLINLKSTKQFTLSLSVEINKLFDIDALSLFVFRTDKKRIYFRTVLLKNTQSDFVDILDQLVVNSQFRWHDLELELYDSVAQEGIFDGALFDKFIETKPLYAMIARFCELKSFALSSLTVRGDMKACLVLWSKRREKFSEQNFKVIGNLKAQITLALENLIAFEELEQKQAIKTLQLSIISSINQEKTPNELIPKIAFAINQEIPIDALLCLSTSHRFLNQFHGCAGKVGKVFHYKEFERKLGSISISAEYTDVDKKMFSKAHLLSGERLKQAAREELILAHLVEQYGAECVMTLPIYFAGLLAGCMVVVNRRPFGLSKDDLYMMEQVCSEMGLALDNRFSVNEIDRLKRQLEQENLFLQEEIKVSYNFNEIIGESGSMKLLFDQVSLVAPTESTVLIEGETGTGKELIARAIHNLSPRKDKALVKLNCATLPATLIESELFGHEKGAFTGALEKRIGKFEFADGGTLFLDELGELPLELQAKLLRAIQEREIERIGSNKSIKIDVRIIAATNKNLFEETTKKQFRPDLYYRLNVFNIKIPPLRHRKDDIVPLANHFLKIYSRKMGKPIQRISDKFIKDMLAYDWPGNIRELEHTIENAVILCQTKQLESSKLFQRAELTQAHDSPELKTLADYERDYIIRVLQHTSGRVRGSGGAAQLLNIHPSTLESRMKKLRITKNFN